MSVSAPSWRSASTLLALAFIACAQPASLVPPKTGAQRPRPDRYPGGVKVGRVSITAQGAVRPEDAQRFRDALVEHVETAFPRRDPKQRPIEADLRYEASFTSYGTGIFDIFAATSMGLWPLTPRLGRTQATLRIALKTPVELGARPALLSRLVHTSSKYWIALYSWFRTGPIEEAFAKAHGDAFYWAVHRIDSWWPARAEGQLNYPYHDQYYRPRKGSVRFDFDAKGQLAAVWGHGGWQLIRDDSFYDLPEEGRVSRSAELASRAHGFWRQYLGALSGLEVGVFTGAAVVESEAEDDAGRSYTIASGRATSKGWKISLFSPPTSSELFIYPTLGFFSLDIDIADFAKDVPLGQARGARDMPAVGSDPKTGEPVDVGVPNVYGLRLRSGYVGQRLGGTAVWGTKRTQLYLSAEGGVNIFEVRHTTVVLGLGERSGFSGMFFHSFAGRGLIGLAYRPWYVGARCELNYELYREFAFPGQLPFEGPVVQVRDEAGYHYERKEDKVHAATAHTVNFFCGIGFVY